MGKREDWTRNLREIVGTCKFVLKNRALLLSWRGPAFSKCFQILIQSPELIK